MFLLLLFGSLQRNHTYIHTTFFFWLTVASPSQTQRWKSSAVGTLGLALLQWRIPRQSTLESLHHSQQPSRNPSPSKKFGYQKNQSNPTYAIKFALKIWCSLNSTSGILFTHRTPSVNCQVSLSFTDPFEDVYDVLYGFNERRSMNCSWRNSSTSWHWMSYSTRQLVKSALHMWSMIWSPEFRSGFGSSSSLVRNPHAAGRAPSPCWLKTEGNHKERICMHQTLFLEQIQNNIDSFTSSAIIFYHRSSLCSLSKASPNQITSSASPGTFCSAFSLASWPHGKRRREGSSPSQFTQSSHVVV